MSDVSQIINSSNIDGYKLNELVGQFNLAADLLG